MPDYDFIIIGGGVAGLGALDALLSTGHSKVALFEARDTLMYSNTWMKNIELQDNTDSKNYTGADFRMKILSNLNKSNMQKQIHTGMRVYFIDQKEKKIYLRTEAGEREEYSYNTLVAAVGAAQIMYGKYLLPGSRGGRFFTSYQVGEMIEHYPFNPGEKLIIFGESLYTLDTALLAKDEGLSVTVVSPSKLTLPENWPGGITVYDNAVLKQVYGDSLFEGMLIQKGSAQISIPGDSIAVDGDFVLEHPWREHLAVEWDLNKWKLDLSMEEMKKRDLIVVGDAYMPNPDFCKQYQSGSEMLKEFNIVEGV
ncbi:MAG: FAD-dependent oxidoreductase [Spirochaetota bacterium]|nr:FAD-dependent oxidoreductase [Spirochaetota bacterium]